MRRTGLADRNKEAGRYWYSGRIRAPIPRRELRSTIKSAETNSWRESENGNNVSARVADQNKPAVLHASKYSFFKKFSSAGHFSPAWRVYRGIHRTVARPRDRRRLPRRATSSYICVAPSSTATGSTSDFAAPRPRLNDAWDVQRWIDSRFNVQVILVNSQRNQRWWDPDFRLRHFNANPIPGSRGGLKEIVRQPSFLGRDLMSLVRRRPCLEE